MKLYDEERCHKCGEYKAIYGIQCTRYVDDDVDTGHTEDKGEILLCHFCFEKLFGGMSL